MIQRVLIVDDEQNIRIALKGNLEDEGYIVEVAENAAQAITFTQTFAPDVVLLDIWLPDEDGLLTLEKIKNVDPLIHIIMMSGHGSIETAVKSLKNGAFDYLEKPIHTEKLFKILFHAFELRTLRVENSFLNEELEYDSHSIMQSQVVKNHAHLIDQLGGSHGHVFLIGEIGTGKEMVARAIHFKSPKAQYRFVPFRYIASQDSENFRTNIKKTISSAQRSTLYLDKIDLLSREHQEILLNELAQPTLSCRLISSVTTQHDKNLLPELKQFLKKIPVQLLPLRQRKSDFPHLIKEICGASEYKFQMIQELLIEKHGKYNWPGNVKEFKNWVEKELIHLSVRECQ